MTKMSERELQKELFLESVRLDNIDTYETPYEKTMEINAMQDEIYHKWKLLKGIREAREKLNVREDKEKQILETSKKIQTASER